MNYFTNFSLLRKNRNFCLLYAGQFVSLIGSIITGVAIPYQVYQETHSNILVGLVSLVQLAPLLITALIGGTLADRYHRRRLLLIAELILSGGALLFAINAGLSHPSLWFIFVVAAIMSGFNGLHRPAMGGLTQQLIDKPDFPTVATLSNFMFSISLIAGPAIAGLLIAHFGLIFTYLVDFATYIFSLGMIFLVAEAPKPASKPGQSGWAALKEGIHYAFSRQELIGSYAVDFVAMVFGMPMALFPAIAHLHGGPRTLGLLYSMPAVGSLCISFYSGWVNHIQRQGAAIAISASIWGVAIIGFGLLIKFNLAAALCSLAIAGGADAVSGIFRSTLWNQTIPTEFRGRLSGIEMISYLSGPKLGDAEAGIVAAIFGVTASIISGGFLCILGVGACCYYLPKFWKYRAEN